MKLLNFIAAFFVAPTAIAQSDLTATQAVSDATPEFAVASEDNPDSSADDLNSLQQLQQSFTLKRTINGETQTEQRTIVYTDDIPVRESEAEPSIREQIRTSFDSEVLTRVEAFEEAKIDFTLADNNNDGAMTSTEFATLVAVWNENAARQAAPPNQEIAKQREYDAFLNEISAEETETPTAVQTTKKFMVMAGAAASITRSDFIREYLLDFDSMDSNNDTILMAEELSRFRAIVRGEAIPQEIPLSQ